MSTTSLTHRTKTLAPRARTIPVLTNGIKRRAQKSTPARPTPRALIELSNGPETRICVQRKLGGIGDIVMSTPTVQAFKEVFPDCELTYSTVLGGDLEAVLAGNPFIDKFVDCKTIKQDSYDYFVDITTAGLAHEMRERNWRHRIDLFAEYAGIRLTNKVPTYICTEAELVWAKTYVEKSFKTGAHQVVFLDISSVDQRRTWPVQHSIELVGLVNATRTDVRFLVNDFSGKNPDGWNYRNCTDVSKFGLRQKAALVAVSDCFVGPDSGMLHIAGALDKPIVATFGSTPAASRLAYYKRALVATAGLPCTGCGYRSCSIDFACMKQLESSSVKSLLMKQLDA